MTTSNEPDRLYHLALANEWRAAVDAGVAYRRSSIGLSLDEEGFIHCSFPSQVPATADRFYRGRTDVVLLTIDPALLDAEVKVENLHGGDQLFPHIYGPLPIGAVVAATPLPLGPDGRVDAAGS